MWNCIARHLKALKMVGGKWFEMWYHSLPSFHPQDERHYLDSHISQFLSDLAARWSLFGGSLHITRLVRHFLDRCL